MSIPCKIAPNNGEDQLVRERAYQLEMLRASVQQNIIVAMGTGTGKTLMFVSLYGLSSLFQPIDVYLSAILRIREEMNMNPNKLIWFLCPTVALCEQQIEVLRSHLPSSRPRSFTGRDQVDHWGEKAVWDSALAGVRVVVSTHQVLLDVLTHGFMKMDQLSLLVFDEAHHCTKNSPANRIMKTFYHPHKHKVPNNLPRILGLSASPVNSDVSSLEKLEINLDSKCMAPVRHYQELLKFTNHPKICICHYYDDNELRNTAEPWLLKIMRDMADFTDKNNLKSRISELRQFIRTSETLYHELGSWATSEYMYTSIKHFKEHQREHAETNWSASTAKDLTMQILCDLGSLKRPKLPIMPTDLSPKCQRLLQILSRLIEHDFQGLIFAAQRATVMILKSLIDHYFDKNYKIRCGSFVGMSNIQSRTDLGNWHCDIRSQKDTLAKFRAKELNLIITTNALEEGIDIPACNTVISFDRPLSLRSFVQRRGRARQGQSALIILVGNTQEEEELKRLIKIEDGLMKTYRDDTRAVSNSSFEEVSSLSLEVKSTGACLNMSDAPSHLNIFCARLVKQPYVINRPIYHHEESRDGQMRAMVTLPSVLHPYLQVTKGLQWWASRKLANADAALQAYKALLAAGLVNDYLLPKTPSNLFNTDFPTFKAIHLVIEPIDPWADLAARWNNRDLALYSHRLQIQHARRESLELMMIIPLHIQRQIQFPLFTNDNTKMRVSLWPGSLIAADNRSITLYRQVTHLIFQSVHGHLLKYAIHMDFVALFVPDAAPAAMEAFLEGNTGKLRLEDALKNTELTRAPGLLRDPKLPLVPWIMNSWLSGPSYSIEDVRGGVQPLPRRRNFLSPCLSRESRLECSALSHEAQIVFFEGRDLTMDRLPFKWGHAALYIPSISYEIGVCMVAEYLQERLLLNVKFHSLDLLSLAIRPTCSERPARFRSLALVGAAFLKYIISEQLFLHHPTWHEGLLSKVKKAVISDCGLAQAAKICQLDRFLVTKRFNGKKWKPTWISGFSSPPGFSEHQKVSARTLAEMIRAIVGAAYVDGGSRQAASCAVALIPAVKTWHAAALHDGSFKHHRPSLVISYSLALHETEELLGYTFRDRSLLVEALTHPSYYASGLPQTSAYGRLSFLGDAVLELVTTQSLLNAASRILSVDRLQSLRTAVTNHLFLTFLCLEFHLEVDPSTEDFAQPIFSRTVDTLDEVYLWTCLQSHSQELTASLNKFRSASRRDCWRIQRALLKGRYPWSDLAAMGGHVVLSDIVKSLLGAVFVDSQADLRDCQHLADRIGILRRAKQFLRDEVITDHPKILLQKANPKAKIFYQSYTIPMPDNTSCCAVWLNDEKAVDLQGFPNRDAAMISASQALARLLEEKSKSQ
ncbi:ATP-dependent helicase dcl2-2 [Penicillium herquei]|nr:ATP-dependent helicase dcl2-2 [Penicillium herquei]